VAVTAGPAVSLWDVAGGKRLRVLDPEKGASDTILVALLPGGKQVLWVATWVQRRGDRSEEGDEEVRKKSGYFAECYLHDAATGKEVRHWSVTGGTGKEINAAAVSPDGKTLAVAAADRVELSDVGTGKRLRSLPGAARGRRSGIGWLAFSPDSKRIAVSEYEDVTDAILSVFAVADGERLLRRKEETSTSPGWPTRPTARTSPLPTGSTSCSSTRPR
jgi:WD40 repeat protein